VELPPQPPQLTPEAAPALLRVLLKARAAREHKYRQTVSVREPLAPRRRQPPRGEGQGQS